MWFALIPTGGMSLGLRAVCITSNQGLSGFSYGILLPLKARNSVNFSTDLQDSGP